MGLSAFETLCKLAGKAVGDYDLIRSGDRILVGLSGGKDSYVLARVLSELQKRAPVDFELFPATFDPGFPDFGAEKIAEYCRREYGTHHMCRIDVGAVMREKNWDKSPCVLCSRLRRGALYGLAERLRCNKLALGHHLDDLETSFLMSLFRGQGLSTMPPKMTAKEHPVCVIRPLALAEEKLIVRAGGELDFPRDTGKCAYHALLEDGDRKRLRRLLEELEKDIPHIKRSMLHSMGKVETSHLLDRRFLPDEKA